MNTPKLKGCPFCGNNIFSTPDHHDLRAIIIEEIPRTTVGWGLPADKPYKQFYVRCGNCYARSGVGESGYNALTDYTVTEEEARQIAIDKWNMRSNEL